MGWLHSIPIEVVPLNALTSEIEVAHLTYRFLSMNVMSFVEATGPAIETSTRSHVGFDNILEHDGLGIALTGLMIVFIALALIAIFISLLPHALKVIASVYPETSHGHIHAPITSPTVREKEQVAAAVGFALHQMNRDNSS